MEDGAGAGAGAAALLTGAAGGVRAWHGCGRRRRLCITDALLESLSCPCCKQRSSRQDLVRNVLALRDLPTELIDDASLIDYQLIVLNFTVVIIITDTVVHIARD